jgi:CheY-like chemotaxis protein
MGRGAPMIHLNPALSVVVAEDNDDYRQVLGQILGLYGFQPVRLAADGQEAWEQLEEAPADLLITDINMPRVSGVELMRRARERWPHMPIVVITGYEHELHHLDAFEVSGTLIKPLKMNLLDAVICRIFPVECGGGEAPPSAGS